MTTTNPLFYISATCPITGYSYTDRIHKPSLSAAVAYTRKNYPHPWEFEIFQHTGATSDV